jgi:hypothetical protein
MDNFPAGSRGLKHPMKGLLPEGNKSSSSYGLFGRTKRAMGMGHYRPVDKDEQNTEYKYVKRTANKICHHLESFVEPRRINQDGIP